MIKTNYRGLKVFADFDKTQCGLNIAIDEGYFITTEMERGFDNPILIQGKTEYLKDSKDVCLSALYEEIKGEKYFIILSNM